MNSGYSQSNSPGASLFLLTSLQNLTKNILFLSLLYLGIISLVFEAVPQQALLARFAVRARNAQAQRAQAEPAEPSHPLAAWNAPFWD